MFQSMIRTDLAVEIHEHISRNTTTQFDGVNKTNRSINGVECEIVDIVNDEGVKVIGKPLGKYITMKMDAIMHREANEFENCVSALVTQINEISQGLDNKRILVVGLGNSEITPDCVGTIASKNTLVTGHLKKLNEKDFDIFGDVYVIQPGVMGTTGIESAVYIKYICEAIKPDFVIVIDSLASASLDRLCRTIQITNTGISPGSGVGNSRAAINAQFLEVPTIAIGVPTVVDLANLLLNKDVENADKKFESMIVTPRGIDEEVRCAGRIIGYAINLAAHSGISIADVDMFLG